MIVNETEQSFNKFQKIHDQPRFDSKNIESKFILNIVENHKVHKKKKGIRNSTQISPLKHPGIFNTPSLLEIFIFNFLFLINPSNKSSSTKLSRFYVSI